MFLTQKIKQRLKSTLLWSQRYTRTDMLYLAKGGFWLTLGDFSSSTFALLSAIAFANLIPQETYGLYKYILSVAGILSIATLSGLGTSVTKSVAQGFYGSVVPAVKTKMRWGLLGLFGGLVLAVYYFIQNNNVLGFAFLIVGLLIPLVDPFSMYTAYLEGRKKFDLSSRYRIIGNIVTVAILVATIYLTDNIFLILLGYFIPGILINYIFYRIATADIPVGSLINPTTNSFGKHLSVLGALGIIGGQLDKILLWNFLGAAPLAIYSFAIAPVNQILAFIKNILPLAFPKLAERPAHELRKILPYKMLVMSGAIILIVLAYIASAQFLFKTVFPQYYNAIFYSQIFALSLLLVPRNLLSDALVAQGEKKKIYILNIANSLFRFPLMIILIGLYGIWGAITSYLLSGLFGFLLVVYLFFWYQTE